MSLALVKTEFYQKLNHPNSPAYSYLNDERLQQDVWEIRETLPHLAEDAQILGCKTIGFKKISLKWLKELPQIVVLVATGSRRWNLGSVICVVTGIYQFNSWLIDQDYISPLFLSQKTAQEWLKVTSPSSSRLFVRWCNTLYQIGGI
jgi:hypothetical protein